MSAFHLRLYLEGSGARDLCRAGIEQGRTFTPCLLKSFDSLSALSFLFLLFLFVLPALLDPQVLGVCSEDVPGGGGTQPTLKAQADPVLVVLWVVAVVL